MTQTLEGYPAAAGRSLERRDQALAGGGAVAGSGSTTIDAGHRGEAASS